MNGIPKTGYLNSIGFDSGRIYIYAEEGYEVKILRNGVDVTEHLGERGVYDGIECPYIQLDVPAPVDGQATWVITVSRQQTDAGSTANVGDVNQDGSITIADVTLLVDIVLGKAVAPGPISNVVLDYDVTLKPDHDTPMKSDGSYATLDIPVSNRLTNAFRLTAAEMASKSLDTPAEPQNDEIELVSYNADGTPYDEFTTYYFMGKYGYWFDANGYPDSWGGTSKVAVWFDKNAAKFVISTHPEGVSGDTLTATLVLIYKNDSGETATATVNFHITYDAKATNTATLR